MMYEPTLDELREAIRLHSLWLQEKKGGVKADINHADLKRFNLLATAIKMNGNKGNLRDINLNYADLSCVDLSSTFLCGANLYKTNLYRAELYWADLSHANFEYANLTDADLRWANMDGANFKNTNLRRANLNGADMRNADFTGADLDEAILCWTVGNNREVLTVIAGFCHVNITDHEVWINEHHHTWDEWLALNDNEILKIESDDEDSIFLLEWWQEWKPKLTAIIDERRASKGTTETQGIASENIILFPALK